MVHQGETLMVHVFGVSGGAGVYTMDIDVLPQVVSIQAESMLPGTPNTSFVITLQGDRLDPATATNPANYTVIWFGPDGKQGTDDDVGISLGASAGGQAVVYDPGANIDVASGLTYATAVRQTITLYFRAPLAAGDYAIELSPNIKAAAFSSAEAAANDHPLVSVSGGKVGIGTTVDAVALKKSSADLNTLSQGTSSLTQLDDNMNAYLNQLSNKSIDPSTATLMQQFQGDLLPGYSAGRYLLIWLDPVSINLADPSGERTVFDLQTNSFANNSNRTFIEVGGKVEVMVIAAITGTFTLNVSDVQATARGGALILDNGQLQAVALTDAMRGGESSFPFTFAGSATVSTTPGSQPTGTLSNLFTSTTDAVIAAASNAASDILSSPAGREIVSSLVVVALTGGGDISSSSSSAASVSTPSHDDPSDAEKMMEQIVPMLPLMAQMAWQASESVLPIQFQVLGRLPIGQWDAFVSRVVGPALDDSDRTPRVGTASAPAPTGTRVIPAAIPTGERTPAAGDTALPSGPSSPMDLPNDEEQALLERARLASTLSLPMGVGRTTRMQRWMASSSLPYSPAA